MGIALAIPNPCGNIKFFRQPETFVVIASIDEVNAKQSPKNLIRFFG
ncbi:MAG: hypothetical protein IJV35_00025 [Neisseriaceae bacterium]|nr:hypothetical protein [Neisseriaceae bacterium]